MPFYSPAIVKASSCSRADRKKRDRVRNASISGLITGIWPSFGAQQHSNDACDPQPGTLGHAASVSLVQQNQVRGQLQHQRDGLGLTGIEIGCEQSRDLSSRSARGSIQPSWRACWISFSAAG